MPQIANQDYQKFSVSVNAWANIRSNQRLLAFLAKSFSNGTIYDVLIAVTTPDYVRECRVLAAETDSYGEHYVYVANGTSNLYQISFSYSYLQYTVRADMQDGGMDLSSLSVSEDGYLYDGEVFACVDGNYIAVTENDGGLIDSYTLTNIQAVGVEIANIPIDNVPGLIGLNVDN